MSTHASGRIGPMRLHRAVCNGDNDGILAAIDAGDNINEVEAAGNTPLHNAAFVDNLEMCELLLSLGADPNASNNAGDTPWHWAMNMGHKEVAEFLERNGATKEFGMVLVPDHVPKVDDFYDKHPRHPKPSSEWLKYSKEQEEQLRKEMAALIPSTQ